QRCRDASGLVFGTRRIPYGELADAVEGLAGWLAKRGLGMGDRIGVMAANEPALVAMLFAVWGVGAVAVAVSVRSTPEEAARLLEHSRARALVCDDKRAEVARSAATSAAVAAFVCDADVPLGPRLLRRAQPASARRPG